MKTWIKVVLGITAVIAVAIGAVFYLTAGMTKTADAFFSAVKQHDMAAARGYLSEGFKANTDEAALQAFLDSSALSDFREASWSSRSMNGDRGQLDGSITTDTGGVVPVQVTFVKEKGGWKIYGIRKPTAGLQSEDEPVDVPDITARATLVKQSMHDFLVSVAAKDMTHFHASVSNMWKKQTTPEALNDAFRPITEAQADWSVLDTMEPNLSPDAPIDDNGVMTLSGDYPTQPSKVHFKQKYLREGIDWRLIGFNIEAG